MSADINMNVSTELPMSNGDYSRNLQQQSQSSILNDDYMRT